MSVVGLRSVSLRSHVHDPPQRVEPGPVGKSARFPGGSDHRVADGDDVATYSKWRSWAATGRPSRTRGDTEGAAATTASTPRSFHRVTRICSRRRSALANGDRAPGPRSPADCRPSSLASSRRSASVVPPARSSARPRAREYHCRRSNQGPVHHLEVDVIQGETRLASRKVLHHTDSKGVLHRRPPTKPVVWEPCPEYPIVRPDRAAVK